MNRTEKDKFHILIADDEPLFGRTTAELLRKAGYDVVWVESGEQALDRIRQRRPDLAVVDLNMPGNLSLELLFECRRSYPSMPLVVLTGRPTLPSAIESVRLGIHDYLLKPIEIDDLIHSLRRALPESPAKSPDKTPEKPVSNDSSSILGSCPATDRLKETIRKIARTSANVLVRGESGTGKELAAREVHLQSRRGDRPFVVIDCSAIPENLLESTLFGHSKGAFTGATSQRTGLIMAAHGGTAFFDEIGELPLPLQSKLLRVIQFGTFLPVGSSVEEKVDIRVVAATNRDLIDEIAAGNFRQDLYYRLAVLEVVVPPLRDRRGDIAEIASSFLAEIAAREGTEPHTLSPEALQILERYRWPGNVRELRNVMERAACLADSGTIGQEDLPDFVLAESSNSEIGPSSNESVSSEFKERDDFLKATDQAYLESLLKKHGGNVTAAARDARLTRQGLHKCLKRAGLNADDFRH
jgi:DNA-binding NtrC family response regulator